jgi:hypothetical protein
MENDKFFVDIIWLFGHRKLFSKYRLEGSPHPSICSIADAVHP